MDDRISALPRDVIRRILSFLSTKDIACLSVLSKPFKSAWTTLPELIFDASFFGGEEELLNFVDRTLRNRHTQKIGLSKLVIDLSSYNLKKVGNLVYRWIRYAVDCNVKEFELDGEHGWYQRYHGRYELPPHSSLFSAPSMTMLTLRGRIDLVKCNIMKNLSLQKLVLKKVGLSDQIVHTLISSCPELEFLKLKECDGLKSVKIFGVSKLKTLYLKVESDFECVDIEAIHLESFVFSGTSTASEYEINLSGCVNLRKFGLFSLKMATNWLSDLLAKLPITSLKDLTLSNAYSLPNNILDVVSAFENLTRLSLNRVTTLSSNWFQDLLSKCPLLEELDVECDKIKADIITISSCLLEKLLLETCYQKKQVEIEIDTPNLHSFKFIGNLNVSISWKYDLVLSKANIRIPNEAALKKTEFLAKFNHCQTLKLYDTYIIVPENEREGLMSPLYNVQHLKVRPYEKLKLRHIIELVEGLLWFSPRPQTLSILWANCTSLLKFTYEEGEDRKGANCFCTSLPITCWRHCLKNIEFNNFTRSEVASLKNFFSEKVDDLTRSWLKDST